MSSSKLKKLIQNGYFKFDLDKKEFVSLKKILSKYIRKKTGFKKINLEKFHNQLNISDLNEIRLELFKKLNKNKIFKKSVFESSKEHIEMCVGSEICTSDSNLSIQFPNDETSLLSMHTDFFSGESLFQINLWIPFVDVKKTQSMFIINPSNSLKILKRIKNDKNLNFETIDKKYKSKMKWINLKAGEAILFSPNCLHGNVVNKEKNTRWSLNVRYKNIFSPYSKIKNEKKIGSFYKPISLKGITKFNLEHGFNELF